MRQTTRHLGERFGAWRAGRISFAELDASVQGWVNHVRYADTWGLRRTVLGRASRLGTERARRPSGREGAAGS